MKDWMDEQRALLVADAKVKAVDQLLAQTGQGENIASEIVKREQEITQLRASLVGLDSNLQKTQETLLKTEHEKQGAEKREKTLNDKLKDKSDKLEETIAKNSKLEVDMAKVRSGSPAGSDNSFAFLSNRWFIVCASVAGVIILGLSAALASTIVTRKQIQDLHNEEEPGQYQQPPTQ
jgi:hypothetical protein